MKVDYTLKHGSIRDITPETLADVDGTTQADHNRLNTIARNQLDAVQRQSLNNQAKITELEKLGIKHQTEIDFIKNTPSNFDLAQTELFMNRFGTIQTLLADPQPDAEIITDLYAARTDGNFEFGVLKNPRSKPLGGVDKVVSMRTLFGQTVHGVSYGTATNSLWIVTSDGPGQRGYLFRCSPTFVDGQLNILGYWILNAIAGSTREFQSVAESKFNDVITLFVGVSEDGGGAHHINRYQIALDKTANVVTIADGKESSPGVPIFKATGDILDGEVSNTNLNLLVEKIDISEPGNLRGLAVVNDFLYIVIQRSVPSSIIDSANYSFIRRVRITTGGVSTSGANNFIFKLDDTFEEGLDSAGSTTKYDVYALTPYNVNQVQILPGNSSGSVNAIFNANTDSKKFYISAKSPTTNKKKIALIDLNDADVTNTNDPNYVIGLRNVETLLQEMQGYSTDNTLPFITIMPDKSIIEIEQATSKRKIIALHDSVGFDLFQGDLKYTGKVKRYFNTENFHAQLGVSVDAVAANHTAAITAGPDNNFSFTTAGGTRSRSTGVGSPQTFPSPADIFHYHPYVSGEPLWNKPSFTFAVSDGVNNPIGNVNSIAIEGSVTSGQFLHVGYLSGATNTLLKVPFSAINAVTPQIGADNFIQYEIVTGSKENLVAGNIGQFNGDVAYDPVKQKLWVATNSGFIHNVTDGGTTLNYLAGSSFAVVKLYSGTSGIPLDGSQIVALSVYDNMAYVGMKIPNNYGDQPTNTVVRVFDLVKSSSTQPFSTSVFCLNGIAKDFDVSDRGMFVTDGRSKIASVFNSQYYKNIFESTEVLDEFNFFKNPLISTNNSAQLGFNITASTFMEKVKSSNAFQTKEWVLPRRAMAFGLYTDATVAANPGKLQIIDYSDIDNPLLWAEFLMVNTSDRNITHTGLSGSLLYGSGQIDALSFVDDKLFVGRRDSGFGTHIEVIDFASNAATIINAPFLGSGNVFSGMKFGYKNAETDRTGGLNERNNPSFHYSGFVNANIKIGHTQINDMSSALVSNNTTKSILTPYVAVGRKYGNDLSGSVDIVNGNTLESVIGIGPGNVIGQGSVKKIHMNDDGSVIVGYESGIIAKITDVRLIDKDGADYFTDFLADKVRVWYPDSTQATGLTDMKIQHFVDTLGNHRNIVYASYGSVSGSPTLATKFVYEDVALAGGALTLATAGEFLNNAETIYYTATASPGAVSTIDFMDNRVFLGFNDAVNSFRLAILKKLDVTPEDSTQFSNNWSPILGDNGFIDKFIDYDDLHYNGIKASINNLISVPRMSLLFAGTQNGSVLFKFPFVTSSKWFSTIKTITQDINAVALARDAVLEDGFVTEFIPRNDQRLIFEGSWSDSVSGFVQVYTSPLNDKPLGKKQMSGKLLRTDGTPYPANSYTNFQAFTVAPDNNFNVFLDGQPVANFGYDFTSNFLMIDKDDTVNNVMLIDLMNITPFGAVFKPIFAPGNKAATISLNDENSVLSFFQTQSDALVNSDGSYQEKSYNLDVSNVPVVQVFTLDGRPLATFQSASSTGETTGINQTDLVKSDLASTEKVILDANGNPVNIVVITGRKIKSEGKFVKRVSIATFEFSINQTIVVPDPPPPPPPAAETPQASPPSSGGGGGGTGGSGTGKGK